MAEESNGVTKDPAKLRERIELIEKNGVLLAKALKRAEEEIYSEWGEELVPPGTVIFGVEF